ncbi:MAG TPA: hypothetical protein VHP11_17970 [Tepidisphaeraceae bacterium]|nr:hypothetical protein [Tepidisphaeraceae bacterium]
MAIFSGKFQRVVFIVSSGRTGTKALAHHLSVCYDNVHAVHEPTPSWRLRRASSRAMAGRISKAELVEKLAYCRRQMVAQVQTPIYVESNPFLAGFLEAFGEVFDNPMVLHVVRDPRTYVRSALNWGSYSGIKKLASNFCPYWTVKPEHFANNTDTPWMQMTDRQRAAWYWKTVNTDLNRGQELLGDRYLRIRFEDLFARSGA